MTNTYKTLGTAVIRDIDKLMEWLEGEGKNYISYHWSEENSKRLGREWTGDICFYELQTVIPNYREAERIYESENAREALKECCEYYRSVGQEFCISFMDEAGHFAVLVYGTYASIIPVEFLELHLYEDYSSLPVSQIRSLTGAVTDMSLLPAQQGEVSLRDVKTKLEKGKSGIEAEKEKIKKLEQQMNDEIEEYKRQLQLKYKEKMDIIEEKKRELEEQAKQLENQLFILDSEIYAIRCYNGEVIKFMQLTAGKESDIEVPLVINQKIRFLDEELGKALAIYDFNGNDSELKYFEDILRARADILELFLPQEKCVSFIKVSKSNVEYGMHKTIANVLDAYQKYHGKTIGILIRNGRNVYIGWTDESRISISDDNAFLKQKKEISDVDDYSESSSKEEIVSRYFVFSALQGILDTAKIIHLPEKVSILKPSPYIVMSLAEGWVEDNRYGTFTDIVKKTDLPLKKGDSILTVMRVTRDDVYSGRYSNRSTVYDAYNNNRGRGEKNRTHDVSLSNATVYPVNQIDRYDYYNVHILKYPEKNVQGAPRMISRENREVVNKILYGYKVDSPETFLEVYKRIYHVENEKAVSATFVGTEYHTFVSEVKNSCLSSGNNKARANFEIYKEEYLNLTFLNSAWLEYAIRNRKMGGWQIGGLTVDYAKSIKYLNIALQHVREREKAEAEMIRKAGGELWSNWMVELSEWKIHNNIHYLTDTRAKRFLESRGK